MSNKVKELEKLDEMLTIAIAREQESINFFKRACQICKSGVKSEKVQKEIWLLVNEKRGFVEKLRKQLHDIKLELMLERGARKIKKSIVINASPDKIFALIADIERRPEWTTILKDVKITSKKHMGVGVTSHWVGEAGGELAEWDRESTEWVENERIAYRTTSGNLPQIGSTTLKSVEGGTKVTFIMNYELPNSILGRVIDKLKISKDIENGFTDSLQNLKKLFEN
jgi:uncharacterized membrane protein